jgi:hypothetical protein
MRPSGFEPEHFSQRMLFTVPQRLYLKHITTVLQVLAKSICELLLVSDWRVPISLLRKTGTSNTLQFIATTAMRKIYVLVPLNFPKEGKPSSSSKFLNRRQKSTREITTTHRNDDQCDFLSTTKILAKCHRMVCLM